MSESLMPTVVYIGTFIMVAGLLIAGLAKVVALNRVAQSPGDAADLVGGDLFNFVRFDADPDEYIDPATDILEDPSQSIGEFEIEAWQTTYSAPEPYTQRDVACYVVRNATAFPQPWENYKIEEPGCQDYLLFYQSKHVYWGWYSYSHAYVTFDMIAAHINTANYSDLSFKLWDWFTVRFWVGSGTELMTAVYANSYNITLGLSWNSSIATTSPWSMVGQFLTFQLPNIDPYLNMLLAIPVWLAIGFLCLTIISRFIPLVPGG